MTRVRKLCLLIVSHVRIFVIPLPHHRGNGDLSLVKSTFYNRHFSVSSGELSVRKNKKKKI